MAEPILHHYDMSPYAEKIRAIFGFKAMAWRSVQQPAIMPKPALTPLTGGYRRIPVLQIGADVYCDTALIAETLEKLKPSPPLFPEATAGQHRAIGAWAERAIFWPAARFVVGINADKFDPQFHADRAAMWGVAPSVERMRKAASRYAEQLTALLPMLEQMLAPSGQFLLGAQAGYADFCVYHCLWFMRHSGGSQAEPLLAPRRALNEWMARVQAFGHGGETVLTREEALAEARAAKPAGNYACQDEAHLRKGLPVSVRAEEFGRESVSGEIAGLTANSMTILRRDPELGEIAVHFPRLGYSVAPVA